MLVKCGRNSLIFVGFVFVCSGETFTSGEAGIATQDTVCTNKAVGISVETNIYEPHLLAGTMAHMIGHNVGMGHDDGRKYYDIYTNSIENTLKMT